MHEAHGEAERTGGRESPEFAAWQKRLEETIRVLEFRLTVRFAIIVAVGIWIWTNILLLLRR